MVTVGTLHDLGDAFGAQITRLYLDSANLTTDITDACSRFPNLEHISLIKSYRLRNFVTEPFLTLRRLRSVDLTASPRVGPDAIIDLTQRLPQLTHLKLEQCLFVDDACLRAISRCTGLADLNIDRCIKATDAGLAALSVCTNLTSLSISNCFKITSAGLVSFFEACGASLRTLIASGVVTFDDAALQALIDRTAPRLQALVLKGAHKLTSPSMRLLSRCRNLSRLDLSRVPAVDDPVVDSVTSAGAALLELSVAGCTQLTDLAIDYVVERCPDIRHLDLFSCYGVSADAFGRLAGCRQLRHVNVRFCRQLTPEAFTTMAAGCVHLQMLYLGGVDENARMAQIASAVRRLRPGCMVHI